MRRSCCGSRPRGVPDEVRIGREIRDLAERARTSDDEYKEHLTTVNIGTVGTFSVTVRNTASGLSPTASPLASLRVLPRRSHHHERRLWSPLLFAFEEQPSAAAQQNHPLVPILVIPAPGRTCLPSRDDALDPQIGSLQKLGHDFFG